MKKPNNEKVHRIYVRNSYPTRPTFSQLLRIKIPCLAFLSNLNIPTSPFTILEPQNPWIDEFYVVPERPAADFIALKLQKSSSGFFFLFPWFESFKAAFTWANKSSFNCSNSRSVWSNSGRICANKVCFICSCKRGLRLRKGSAGSCNFFRWNHRKYIKQTICEEHACYCYLKTRPT